MEAETLLLIGTAPRPVDRQRVIVPASELERRRRERDRAKLIEGSILQEAAANDATG